MSEKSDLPDDITSPDTVPPAAAQFLLPTAGMKVSPSIESIDLGSDSNMLNSPGDLLEDDVIPEEEGHISGDKVNFQIEDEKNVPSLQKYFGSDPQQSGEDAFFDTISTMPTNETEPNTVSTTDHSNAENGAVIPPDGVEPTSDYATNEPNDELDKPSEDQCELPDQLDSLSSRTSGLYVEEGVQELALEGELGTIPTDEQTTSQLLKDEQVENGKSEVSELFESFTAGGDDAHERVSPMHSLESHQDSLTVRIETTSPGIFGSPVNMSPSVSGDHASPFGSMSPRVSDSFPSNISSSDDPFTASLNTSDIDRRHDAWLPSEMTRQSLIAMVTNPPGSFNVENSLLTMPGLLIDDPQGDPVRDLVYKYMGDQEASTRQTLNVDSVPQDEDGLRMLIANECYRAAVDLTGRLLTSCGQGAGQVNLVSKHTPWSLQVWYVRVALMMKLRQYSAAESECQAFGNMDKPDMYYEFYPDAYRGRQGSMLPFEFRILHAELPQFLGKHQEALDRLFYLHGVITRILSNLKGGLSEDGSMVNISDASRAASIKVWSAREKHTLYCTANCLMSTKDYGATLEVLEKLKDLDPSEKQALVRTEGRIYLQMGDIHTARKCFENASTSNVKLDAGVECRHLMNKGFLALAEGDFEEAKSFCEQAVQLSPDNAVAVNNLSVCSLYRGELKEAISILENLVHSNSAKHLQEGILFNLCTLYELQSSRALHKKQTLLELVSKHKGNGFNVAALKMP